MYVIFLKLFFAEMRFFEYWNSLAYCAMGGDFWNDDTFGVNKNGMRLTLRNAVMKSSLPLLLTGNEI